LKFCFVCYADEAIDAVIERLLAQPEVKRLLKTFVAKKKKKKKKKSF
jgi:hypothetical protein